MVIKTMDDSLTEIENKEENEERVPLNPFPKGFLRDTFLISAE